MNICFLVKRYYTNKDLLDDKFGRLYYIPVELQKLGHECTVFALDYKNSELHNIVHESVSFRSIPIKSLKFFKTIQELLKNKQQGVDIVISSGDTYIGLLGHWLAKYFGASSVFDLYDNYLSFKYNQNPLMKLVLYHAVKKSDLLVFASDNLRKNYPHYFNKSLTVENSVDTATFFPLKTDKARSDINLQDISPVIGYFGMLRKRRGINELLGAMKKVRKEFPMATLLLAGKKDFDIDVSPEWIIYKGIVPQDKVNLFINASDVVVLPYLKDDFTEMTNACKLNEYIACQKPFVVTDVSDYGSKYYKEHPQCIAQPGDVDSLTDSIVYQIKNRIVLKPDFPITWAENVRPLENTISGLVCND